MKSVLLISRCLPWPLHFGDRLILWHLARELAARGYMLDLLALHQPDDDPAWIEHCRDFFRDVQLFAEPARGPTGYLRRLLLPRARFPKDLRQSFCPGLWQAIEAQLRRRDYDVAHCFGSVSVYEYHPLFAHLPTLITPYESYALYLGSAAARGQIGAKLRLPLARRYERFMYRPYDRVVVIAEADQTMLKSLSPQLDIRVIPNGIELERFQLPWAARDPATLLFVGNFAYPPNQDAARILLTKIMPAVWRDMPRAKLQLVGVNPPDWLRATSDPRVQVTGRVPDVQPWLARATVFICPLRIGAGLKNKLLEALAMGIPVVATPLAAAGIAVEDGASALIRQPDEIAEGALQLLADENLRQRLSQQGRQLIESRYTWSGVATAYERLYDEIAPG